MKIKMLNGYISEKHTANKKFAARICSTEENILL
jgi:hypothetical protein